MKIVWLAGIALASAGSALAQTTIYKQVDEGGHVTYSNKPMKGAVVMDLDPITTVPGLSQQQVQQAIPLAPAKAVAVLERLDTPKTDAKPAPVTAPPTNIASIEPQVQKKREDDRRRILEGELSQEEQSLSETHESIAQEQQNPALVAAVRSAQVATDPTPSQMAETRNSIEKASGRIRGLQATAAEHEKNIEALRKELGALKP
ncbi:MAG TPA: DUF4124 domain-containing protein [Usitatibacter sp.]|jgi:hypothetical protein|nr:DUF4124 domain-containing protein [Usitatibacter sp.]